MMKFLVAVAVSAGAAGTAHALVFEVQAPGTAGFQAVTPLSQDRDLAGFYDYDGPLTDRADPAFFAEANVAHFFLYQDSGATGAAALGLGLIVSSAAGGAGSYDFTLSGAPAGASAAVEDDPEDLFGWDAGGDVDGAFEFDWTAGETDGFGIGDLGDLVWTIQITGLGASGMSYG